MLIAPNFTSEQWRTLNLDNNETDWQTAIDVFRDRIWSRFIEPIETLLDSERDTKPTDRKYGFAILAIDLLLMETIQAFREGLETTEGLSKEVFKRFLIDSPRFSIYFATEEQRENFYKVFRCGILHQAEIQSSALVWSFGELYERAEEMEVLNRNAVHEAVKADIEEYIVLLRNPASLELRTKLRNKMNCIAGRDGHVTPINLLKKKRKDLPHAFHKFN